MSDTTQRAAEILAEHERFKHTQAVGELKATHDLPPSDPAREAKQIARLEELSKLANLDPEFAKKVLNFIIAEERIKMNMERVEYWLGEGAQPTDRIARFLEAAGKSDKKERANLKKGEPGQKAKEREEEKASKAEAAKEAAKEAEAAAKAEAEAPAEEAPVEEAPAEEAPAEEAAAEEAPAGDAAAEEAKAE